MAVRATAARVKLSRGSLPFNLRHTHPTTVYRRAGSDRVLGAFVARVMQDSRGCACPVRVDAALRELLGQRAQQQGGGQQHVGRKAAARAAKEAAAAEGRDPSSGR